MDGLLKKGTTEATGSPQRSQEAGGGEPVGGPPARRVSAKRKLAAEKRLQRGESLELLSRELNVTAARLSDWRDRVEFAAETALKEWARDHRDDAISRLKGKVGEMTMENELLYEKIDRLEGGSPLARRRSRR